MSIYDTWIGRMYPQDKANHYMRGTMVAAIAASLFMAAIMVTHRYGLRWAQPELDWLMLAGAVAGWLAAFLAGKGKEWSDARINAAAVAEGKAPPHGVEVADWQFTHWGAFPVALALVVAQAAAWSLR